MDINNLRNILIVGSGFMGSQIGLQCAIYNYNVTLYDNSRKVLDESKKKIRIYIGQMTKKRQLSEKSAAEAIARIKYTSDPEQAGTEADLISESLPESPKLKCEVFARFHKICSNHTIFTTNTSSLLPSMLAAATGRPQQFAALHFHSLVWENNLVEIMPHPKTAKKTLSLLREFAITIDQVPIALRKEHQSYVFNAMLHALNNSALELASSQVATVEDIDRAWMKVARVPMGPFGAIDEAGLDVAYNITRYWGRAIGSPRLQLIAEFLKKYVDMGHLGVKTGKGFYNYPEPEYKNSKFISTKPDISKL